jgi:hypothetical protein
MGKVIVFLTFLSKVREKDVLDGDIQRNRDDIK